MGCDGGYIRLYDTNLVVTDSVRGIVYRPKRDSREW